MENLSHGALSLVVGELIHRVLPAEKDLEDSKKRRKFLLIASALAGNFPDLDLVLTPLLPEPLGYLIHHRGHTHTLLYSIPQALILWGLVALFWKSARNLLKKSSGARVGLLLATVFGFLSHLGLDYLNSYGVHPFHPFDSEWVYGDMVFIVEPFFWIVFGSPMIMTLKNNLPKFFLFAFILGVPLIATFLELLNWPSFLALFLLCCGFILFCRPGASQYKRQTLSLAGALFLALIFIGVQSKGSDLARRILQQNSPTHGLELVDASLSSFPSNPFCWMFVSVERASEAQDYLVKRGVLSLAPEFVSAFNCPQAFRAKPQKERVKERKKEKESKTKALMVFSEQNSSLAQLRSLAGENCFFNIWLRFARIPVLVGEKAWDARFQRGRVEDNFTYINLERFKGATCPSSVPAWEFPRKELIEDKD